METFRLDGFRPWLEKATRVEDGVGVDSDIDWSVHTVDYAAFKRRLLEFSKRRAMLRQMLLASDNDSIPAAELATILGPPPPLPAHMEASQRQQQQRQSKNSEAGAGAEDASSAFLGYVPFVESTSSRSNMNINNNNNRVPLNIEIDSGDISARTCGEHSHHVPRLLQLGSDALYKASQRPPKILKRRAVMRQVSSAERHDLVVFLSWEIDKACMFYLATWQRLSQQLVDLNTTVLDQQSQQLGYSSVQNTATKEALTKLGQEILELTSFCVINVVTVRQALMRYDAFARQFEGTPMMHYTMKKLLKSPTSFRKLLQHQELKALCDSLSDACACGGSGTSSSDYYTDLQETFSRTCQEFNTVLESSERAEATASVQPPVNDTVLQTLRYYFMLGTMEDRFGYEPSYLTSRGQSLTTEMKTLAEWRRRKGTTDYLFKHPQPEEQEPMDQKQLFNLTMALLAAFLYCMNYYIVEPSSTMYVNALGAHDAMSATLIGMMPIASFVSATFFSIWTNHSFRQPFLVASLLLISGNIIYSAAFNFKSIEMALVGRFLAGLGGPKCIVRRYMADTTSLTMRTSVNAGFGMVVAAGSALGPGCAILLNKLNFAIQIPNGEIWFNGMTGPGYFMALMWGLFGAAVFLNFEEPDRSGLEEQKRLEEKEVKGASSGGSVSGHSATATASKSDLSTPSMDSSTATQTTRIMVDGLDVAEQPQQTPQQQRQQRQRQQDNKEDDLMTIFSGATSSYKEDWIRGGDDASMEGWWAQTKAFFKLITFPVRLCLGLLFAKVFVIETLVSATSTLSKNRYGWQVGEVGTLGCINGFAVIPFSILIGRLSKSHQDRALMIWLLGIGLFGCFLLVDVSDLIDSNSKHYNEGDWLAVNPVRYVMGYFLVYISIQSFEGVIGSALSKVIPTALASGTFNSGLLATLTDTFGRSCGDLFISLVAFISLRQLMNLLFIPGVCILIICLIVVRRYYDLLAV
jgi:hypothetical protein